jgi:molybdate transport system ATP-binding protein
MSLDIELELIQSNFFLKLETKISSTGVTVLFGDSGCGKTSLLRCLSGFEHRAKGRIRFNGKVWLDNQVYVKPEQRNIGYVFQKSNLFSHLNVKQNILYATKTRRFKKLISKCGASHSELFDFDSIVEFFDLAKLLHQDISTLSGGEQQKVAIARTLLSQPQLLLMDEPLNGLDQDNKKRLLPYIENLHKQLRIPIIYVTHSQSELAYIAEDLIMMKQGKIIAQGSYRSMINDLNSPLPNREGSYSILDCEVSEVDQNYQLAKLSFKSVTFLMPLADLSVGQKVRARILAKDIILSIVKPEKSSVLNVLLGRVAEIKSAGLSEPSQCLVNMDVCGSIITAKISRLSKEQLEIEPNKFLFIQVKAMALLK